MRRDEKPVVVVQNYPCSVALLWEAITKIDRMRQWYFDNIPAFGAEVGFKTRFDIDTGERIFVHCWEVVEVESGRKIAYNWRFDGYPGTSVSIFEVSGDETSSKLTLTCKVNEDFPDDVPEFSRQSCQGGWNYLIKESLSTYLENACQGNRRAEGDPSP